MAENPEKYFVLKKGEEDQDAAEFEYRREVIEEEIDEDKLGSDMEEDESDVEDEEFAMPENENKKSDES